MNNVYISSHGVEYLYFSLVHCTREKYKYSTPWDEI